MSVLQLRQNAITHIQQHKKTKRTEVVGLQSEQAIEQTVCTVKTPVFVQVLNEVFVWKASFAPQIRYQNVLDVVRDGRAHEVIAEFPQDNVLRALRREFKRTLDQRQDTLHLPIIFRYAVKQSA